MTPRPVDVASVQAKLRSLDELVGALRLVRDVDAARLEQDVLLRLAVVFRVRGGRIAEKPFYVKG
ncbi:hypothetical protein SAMN05660350_01697 [Geodermatophilus obscurus]|uniref:Uncharacterized protein n=1 Tax=Geodermatophilus obscurus TaxID=1861 RepID=A0A1M7TG79_9ACTN|nr:hypothetical protein [Geodermatophilus obscurus]SHN69715.1 hypothetical protein SAMN05660350_01697 [Geodermatophilus obscurus]